MGEQVLCLCIQGQPGIGSRGEHAELTTSRQSLEEIVRLTGGVQEKIEDGRKKVKDITENITTLKEKHTKLTEKRKEMWREDTTLDSLVNRAADELIAVCNNVGDAAFLGPNQKIENPSPQAP
jgi:uncharacterized protein HemX